MSSQPPPFLSRPLDAEAPSEQKYYDIASWLATQATFSFTAAPFIILGFKESLQVWSRVNYYAIFTTFTTLAFFASPAKGYLRKILEQKSREAGGRLSRTTSSENLKEPILGVSADPGKDINEAIQEIQEEVEKARKDLDKKGSEKKKEL